MTRINVRLEGGIGDCLLGNRFIPAILELHPNAEIHAFIDSEGKTFQSDVLHTFYNDMYRSITVIPRKKYKEFWVDCQFGEDNYYGALENVPDDIRDSMEHDCDVFYDLHIDSLKFIDFDFNWLRYFYFFPQPNYNAIDDTYIAFHLRSATSVGHMLEDWYCEKLVKGISSYHKCKIIATQEQLPFYSWANDMTNVEICCGDIKYVGEIICNANMLVSTDSGFRYLAYGAGVPTITFSKHCTAPFQVLKSHEFRWLLFPKQCFPLNFSASMVIDLALKVMDNKAFILFPEVNNFDLEMVRRKYTINTSKTK